MSVVHLLTFDSNFHTGNFVKKTKITNEWANLQKELNNNNILKKTLKILKYNLLLNKYFQIFKIRKSFKTDIQKVCPFLQTTQITKIEEKLKKKRKDTKIAKILYYIGQNMSITHKELEDIFRPINPISSRWHTGHGWYLDLVCDCKLGPIFNSSKGNEQISPVWAVIVKYYYK